MVCPQPDVGFTSPQSTIFAIEGRLPTPWQLDVAACSDSTLPRSRAWAGKAPAESVSGRGWIAGALPEWGVCRAVVTVAEAFYAAERV